jgi:hypothetical protein
MTNRLHAGRVVIDNLLEDDYAHLIAVAVCAPPALRLFAKYILIKYNTQNLYDKHSEGRDYGKTKKGNGFEGTGVEEIRGTPEREE